VRADLFDYHLPDECIAQRPPSERDGGALLLVDGERREHHRMRDFGELVPTGALVVVNDTRVRRARLRGQRRPGGGRVELLLLEPRGRLDDGRERWTALARANKPLRPGTVIDAAPLACEVLSRDPDDGIVDVAIESRHGVDAALETVGHVPIPPYLDRDDDAEDLERYQTVYAERTASVAAPTAGLHLTREMFERWAARGVAVGRLELEVGLGTFRPVTAADLDQHDMHSERYRIEPELVHAIRAARERGAPVVAIGTTVVRALESAADLEREGEVRVADEATRLLIQPGYRFRVVDALLTNFHQPRSTLLALVSAFAGYDALRAAYAEALARGYRFLSYGDAMWLPRRAS
jgi:S-adenosylmethionine:tRNA ribosyltransferase-isomerase